MWHLGHFIFLGHLLSVKFDIYLHIFISFAHEENVGAYSLIELPFYM